MASLSEDNKGLWRIQFVGTDRKRRAIRLGGILKRDAQAFKLRVEHLVTASILGHQPDGETSRWLAKLGDEIHGRLVAVNLAKPRTQNATSLGPFINDHIADRTDAKPRTIINLKQAAEISSRFSVLARRYRT